MIVDSISTLFDFESRGIVGPTFIAVSRDGQNFLARVSDTRGVMSPITLVVNWDTELENR